MTTKDLIIDENQIAQYQRDGAICIRQAVDESWIDRMINHLDSHFDKGGHPQTAKYAELAWSDRYLYKKHNWMRDFIFQSGIAGIAGQLMESSTASVYFDHIFIRGGGTKEVTPWHQDRPYWPFLGKQIASVWVAFSASDENSSAMSFIQGSHQWDKVYKPQAFSKDDVNAAWMKGAAGDAMPDFWTDNDGLTLLSWDTQPGDVIVFGGDVIHAAGMNHAPTGRRIAVSTRFVGDNAVWDPRPGTDPIITQADVSIKPGDIAITDSHAFPMAWSRPLENNGA